MESTKDKNFIDETRKLQKEISALRDSEWNLQKKIFELKTLYEVTNELNFSKDSGSILRITLSMLMGAFGASKGFVVFGHWGDEDWRATFVRGLDDIVISKLNKVIRGSQFENLSPKEQKEILISCLAPKNKRDSSGNMAVWAPIVLNNVPLGGFLLSNRISQVPFLKDDVDLITSVADHAATYLENARLYEELREARERLRLENINLRHQVEKQFKSVEIIGKHPSIVSILNEIKDVATSQASVLIYGETGTGKELIAKTIHYNSLRSDKPFIAVNCAALPESLVESELFGIEAGVATGVTKRIGIFEQADGGTLFIDEIGDMRVSSQAKILRILQERRFRRVGGNKDIEVDIRIIAATNKGLTEEIARGNFREDLYYRLNVIHVSLPPLRERKEDIPLLVNHFVDKYRKSTSKKFRGFSEEALNLLEGYDWYGNVRELENEVERALMLAKEGSHVKPEHLSPKITGETKVIQTSLPKKTGSMKDFVAEIEKKLIQDALVQHKDNKSKVAAELGLSRFGLRKKMDKLGIS